MNLTLEQRDRLLAILPPYKAKATGRRRADLRKVLEGILFVLESGCAWAKIDKYKNASHQTCASGLARAIGISKNGLLMERGKKRCRFW